MRKVLVGIAVLALILVSGAAYATWDVQGYNAGGNGDNTITINCTIPSYIQIWWMNSTGAATASTAGDLTIDFLSSDSRWTLAPTKRGAPPYYDSTGGDAYYTYNQAITTYSGDWPSGEQSWCPGKDATDPWAHAYFESEDQVVLYINTNTDITMAVAPQGLLSNNDGDTLPSWLTMAGAGYGGFLMGGVSYTGGGVLLQSSTDGRYFQPVSGVLQLSSSYAYTAYSNQYCFPMNGGPWTGDFDAPTRGSIIWKARLFRNGMNDVAGTYTGTINVGFSQG